MINFFRKVRLSLLTENKFAKYLVYAIGEIVLVVIGILVALQIHNWNEERILAKQETLYLSRLLSENKQDIITFSKNIKDLEKGNETVEKFSGDLKNNTISDSLLLNSANEYFKYGSIYPIFSSSTSTFDDLSSTGNLTVIKSTELRDRVVQHYARHKEIEERIQIAVSWALPLDAPFTFDNNIMRFEPSTTFLFPEASIASLAKELRENDVVYVSNAAAHFWINNDCIAQLNDLIKETSGLVGKLENELD